MALCPLAYTLASAAGVVVGSAPWTGQTLPWCACEIRRSQVTRSYIQGASLWAQVNPYRGHAPPTALALRRLEPTLLAVTCRATA
jgi:hypothetical protein